jgi:integrase
MIPPASRACPGCGGREWAYVARYRGPDHVEHSQSFPRKVDAETWVTDQLSRRARGEWTDPAAGRRRYDEWVREWWETTSNLRPSTRARDEAYLRSLILPGFGTHTLAAIGQLDVRRWVADLEARGLAPATVRKAYTILGKSLRAAVDAGLIPRTPVRSVPLPQDERREMPFLTPAQIAQLAGAIHPRYRALVLVGGYGGLRIGEMAALRRRRVDILRGRVEVAETLAEVRGHLHFGSPKTRAGHRIVPLPRPVAEELAVHLKEWATDDLVFSAPEAGPLRIGSWRRRFWRPAVGDVGLEGLTPHALRHTAVALWIAAGATPKEVATRAGHASVSRVLDLYGHLYEESGERLTERLEAVFRSSDAGPLRDPSTSSTVVEMRPGR